jgi:hypothetical protein
MRAGNNLKAFSRKLSASPAVYATLLKDVTGGGMGGERGGQAHSLAAQARCRE